MEELTRKNIIYDSVTLYSMCHSVLGFHWFPLRSSYGLDVYAFPTLRDSRVTLILASPKSIPIRHPHFTSLDLSFGLSASFTARKFISHANPPSPILN